ncbi:MAG: hypothetical protein AAF721_18295 [Myxococcota bacterium]
MSDSEQTSPRLRLVREPVGEHDVRGAARRDSGPSVAEERREGESEAAARVRFELTVANDIEHERQLLYRALVVIETIAGLVLAREGLLRWMIQ